MQPRPDSRNVTLLSHHELDGTGKCGEGTALYIKNGRRYLYIAHERAPINFSVLDVTDPRAPQLVQQTRLPHENVRSNSLSVSGDIMIVAYQVRQFGLTPAGIEVFDLTNPVVPRSVAVMDMSGPSSRGTHWVWYVDGMYAFISTGSPDSKPSHPKDHQFVMILDMSRPSAPTEVGRWWLPGTQIGDDAPPLPRHPRFDEGYRSHNINVYPERPDRAYVGYIDGGIVILDIADRSAPKVVSRLDYHPPMPGMSHTVLPLFSRNLLAITDECLRDDGVDHPKFLWIADASVEEKPLIVSTAPVPGIDELPYRGGRYGAHNLHENEPFEWSWRREDIIFGTFFSAGLRAYEVSDPFAPVEVASFVPEPPSHSDVGAIQMNDLFVDAEGLIYATDRSGGGLYILQFDGSSA